MEVRLKGDVLLEAAQYNNQIMVAHENDDFQIVEEWEAVTEVDVQTPLEVYKELCEDGWVAPLGAAFLAQTEVCARSRCPSQALYKLPQLCSPQV